MEDSAKSVGGTAKKPSKRKNIFWLLFLGLAGTIIFVQSYKLWIEQRNTKSDFWVIFSSLKAYYGEHGTLIKRGADWGTSGEDTIRFVDSLGELATTDLRFDKPLKNPAGSYVLKILSDQKCHVLHERARRKMIIENIRYDTPTSFVLIR